MNQPSVPKSPADKDVTPQEEIQAVFEQLGLGSEQERSKFRFDDWTYANQEQPVVTLDEFISGTTLIGQE
jgi:hypothetical protein